MSTLQKLSTSKAFGGELLKYKFKSQALGGLDAQFNIFIPPQASIAPVPLLFYLAGLTCTEDNGPQKGGFLGPASAQGLAILFPDTSPRGAGALDEDVSWDFGTGAGFYLDATAPAYSVHYRMKTHVTEELPHVIASAGLPIDLARQSIFGHSMGGHGALTLYLSSPTHQFRAASAFAPIANPSHCAWGRKAFTGYLAGGIVEGARDYDATEMIRACSDQKVQILIDYGSEDAFYRKKEILPENFLQAACESGHDEGEVRIRRHEGYDHSYYFINTFASDHILYHANFLKS